MFKKSTRDKDEELESLRKENFELIADYIDFCKNVIKIEAEYCEEYPQAGFSQIEKIAKKKMIELIENLPDSANPNDLFYLAKKIVNSS